MAERTRYPLESALAPEQVKKFDAFAQQVAVADGTSAFSEQTLVALHQAAKNKDGSARLFYFLNDNHDIMGAWVAVEPQDGELGVIEGAVAPEYRGSGVASHTVGFMGARFNVDFSRYNVWVHQVLDDPTGHIKKATEHMTRQRGYQPVRDLRKMRLELTADVRQKLADSAISFAEGTQLSVFDAEQDAGAWVALNAAAFASHPEQGKLTRADLDERLASDWFRANGFFILQTNADPAGYIWTKIPTQQTQDFEGEIYAVGISPDWQGKGLGRALTTYALAHLAGTEYEPGTPLDAAVLYVDAENSAAVALYESLGFTNETVDIMYSTK